MKYLLFAIFILFAPTAMAGTNGLDTNFGSGGALLIGPTPQSHLFMGRIMAITALPDGKFLLGGLTGGSDPVHPRATLPSIGRLNADGSWDTGFGDHGLFVLPYGTAAAQHGGEIHHVVIDGDGSLVGVGGAFTTDAPLGMNTCTLIVGLASNGELRSDFGGSGAGAYCFDFAPEPPNGGTFKGHFEDIAINPDDSFLITTGLTNENHGAVAQFLANGTLDSAFGSAGVISVPYRSWRFARQSDGDTLLVGGNNKISIERIDASGALDSSYGDAGILSFDSYSDGTQTNVWNARLDAQDRLIISDSDLGSGFFAPYQIARAESDGTLDSHFNDAQQQPGSPGFISLPISNDSYDSIEDAFPLADGRTLVFGNSSTSSGSSISEFIVAGRLNADASFDAGFGDADHPGWAQITVGSSTFGSSMRVATLDAAGRVLVSTSVSDDANNACVALLRFIPDQLFSGAFDGPAPLACPN